MRPLLLSVWSLLPLAAAGYHFGPGQTAVRVDDAAAAARSAETATTAGDLGAALASYDIALERLPSGGEHLEEEWRLRLERSKLGIVGGRLPAAYDDLAGLDEAVRAAVAEAEADADASETEIASLRDLADEVDETFANARYYMTWLMRLEGRPEAEWRPEIEAARQSYRRLAESAEDEAAAMKQAESSEAAIRLARLGLDELQAMPLPKQCRGQCSSDSSCCGKCKGMKKSMKKANSKPNDARGASSGPPPDGRGA